LVNQGSEVEAQVIKIVRVGNFARSHSDNKKITS